MERARETTPQRALRKVKEKISRSLKKIARGEHDAIVAREDKCEVATPAGPTAERAECAAIAKLDDPTVVKDVNAALNSWLARGSVDFGHVCMGYGVSPYHISNGGFSVL